MPIPLNVHPKNVTSPKRRLRHLHAIYPGPQWSLAVGLWDGTRSMLIRWNDDPTKPLGNPVSHGHPTWFVLPEVFHAEALKNAAGIDAGRAEKARRWLAEDEPVEWPYDADEFPDA